MTTMIKCAGATYPVCQSCRGEGRGGEGRGGDLTLTWYTYMCLPFWECFFTNFGIAIRRFSSQMKEPNLHKLGVF